MSDVDDYIKKQKSPQKEILGSLRKLIQKTFPRINEEMKNGVPWYEGKFYLVALKDHVNLGFSVYKVPEKVAKEFEGKGKYMRHLKFYAIDEIDKKKIVRLFKITDKLFTPCHQFDYYQ